ncbi:MAG: filamentous hemagglutinin N-terminal domain-containing protein [Hassallia sp. WJT32-NPBG1]|jgi:filamentous hemagglutinin family protein|nr:filamentous hemagglutinin N-terminal domain-containing protein [Hassallia sp. WJT32-NPBG1]
MSTLSNRWGWLLGIAFAFSGNCALAQITPDGTLPNNSDVTLQGNTFNITGGTQAGSNLFHSFGQFSVPTGGTAFFNNAVDIQNIISRVTGGSISNIDGLIRANGTANLFLINPSGIVFGQNASLNVGGSFVASTASSLKFADGFEFSATAPETTPLLTISVPIGLQYGVNPGSILNQSQARNSNNDVTVGLQVQPNRTLALVGGDVSLDGGNLQAPAARVELGGLAGTGTVGLNNVDGMLSLSFPNGVELRDVSLSNNSAVNVRASDGGSININARNLDITESDLLAGIGQNLGTPTTTAGDITLNASEAIRINQQSRIVNNVHGGAAGNSGNINITAQSLWMTDNAVLNTTTSGLGAAGNVIINTKDFVKFDGQNTAVQTYVETGGTGKGGDIRITTPTLELTNGGNLYAATQGQGDAGNVIINAAGGRVWFDEVSSASTNVENQSTGKGGDIRINTPTLELTNGGQLRADTDGIGDAGNVIINADTIHFDGRTSTGEASGIFSRVLSQGRGKGGGISITTGSLSVTNGAGLFADIKGVGDGGSIIIDARDFVFFTNGSNLDTATQAQGDAGNVIINAGERVWFDEVSYASTNVENQSTGKGGDIRITTPTLSLTNGGQLRADTNGIGDAGNVIINADTIHFDGRTSTGEASGIFSRVLSQGRGKGGDISITTGSLSVTNGAGLFADIDGVGDGGSIIIDARDFVSFDGVSSNSRFAAGVFTQVNQQGRGNGANVRVTTGSLSLSNQAELITGTDGDGDAGNVIVNANQGVSLDSGSRIITNANPNSTRKGGDVFITTKDFSLANDAIVNAGTSSGQDVGGRSGDITINTTNTLRILNGAELVAGTASRPNAGNITINSKVLTIDAGKIAVNSLETGEAGNIKIFSDNLTLKNQAQISAETFNSQGGNIEINLKDILLLRQNSRISTNAGTQRAGGDGGNITINAPNGFIVAVPQENSDITANAVRGSGGRVDITASGIFGIEPRPRPTEQSDITASSELGVQGTIDINTLNVDPNRGLLQLPTGLVNTPGLASSNCNAFIGKKRSEFTVTGRGGLPPSPDDFLSGDVVWTDNRLSNTTQQQHRAEKPTTKPAKAKTLEIIPATGWVINDKGEVTLISSATSASSSVSPPTCVQQ